jgi:hypothetical protein
LSLVADVLHSWPEYWDESKASWIQIDPTWESTSGIDFYNKMDLRHFAFVVHGKDSVEPYPAGSYKLGSNPQKDVFVSFSQEFTSPSSSLNINTKNYFVSVANEGPNAAKNVQIDVYFDDKKAKAFASEIVPPFGHFDFAIEAPYGFLGQNMPNEIVLVSADNRIVIPTNKQSVIITQVVLILAVVLGVLALVLLIIKRRALIAFLSRIKNNVKFPHFSVFHK